MLTDTLQGRVGREKFTTSVTLINMIAIGNVILEFAIVKLKLLAVMNFKSKLRSITILLLILISSIVRSQSDSSFTISGYADVYYAHDNDKGEVLRQFSAIAPVRDEFRINLAQITGKYSSDRVRGIVTLQFGDIPKYNWPQSPNEFLQYIQEANIGYRPCEDLWVDFGYFLTHIGAEGLIPKDNYFSAMSLATYFEPFYQSGVKVSYDFSSKVYGSLFLLNGYNQLADNNKNKSFGVQLGITPTNKLELIFNNITGNEQPSGSKGKTRFYNNFVVNYAATEKLNLVFGIDQAVQEDSDMADSNRSSSMIAGLLAVKYDFTKKFSVMTRGEFYDDADGILSEVSLKANGISLGFEFRPMENAYARIESRILKSMDDEKIFSDGNSFRDSRIEIIFSTGAEF